jgi:AraC-like DNA-binding protein
VTVEPLVRANVLTGLPAYIALAKQPHVNFVSLLKDVGIRADQIKEPDTLISLNRVGQLFENLSDSLRDPAFGLNYAKHYPIGATGLLGNLVLSAPTVRSSLAAAAEFLAVQTIPVTSSFVEDGGLGHLRWKFASEFRGPRVQFTAFTAGAFLLRIRLAIPPDVNWEPLATHFDHGAPEMVGSYREFFGARLRFDQAANGMILDQKTLDRLMPQDKPLPVFDQLRRLGKIVKDDLTKDGAINAQWADMTTLQRVHFKIRERLDQSDTSQNFDLVTIAADLDITVRDLRWELKDLDTSYDAILGGIRESLAERYLRDADLPISQIAVKLGFAEGATFSRWAVRVYGHSPKAQRDLLRRGGQPLPQPLALDGPDGTPETGDDS